ncbi:hypothetical protein SLS58_001864 [Diplodia intermedia]|uniref:WGR domain-containing protein n=1 Tax=Diplodia intermedia TaxID=856260 RepID=A0ABR3U162_9PEZI
MLQNQHRAPQAPQDGIDPKLLTLMNDDRYYGDLTSQASPFASLGMPNGSQNPPSTSTTMPINPQCMITSNPSFAFYPQYNPTAATPIISNIQQLTPNFSHAPLAPVGNGYGTAQYTSYTPQHQSAAIRTGPAAQQFRFSPYACRNPPIAAAARLAVPQLTSHPTRRAPAVLKKPKNQQAASYTSRAPHAAVQARPNNHQLTSYTAQASSGAVPAKSNSQQLSSRTSHTPSATAKKRPLKQQLGPYTPHNQQASLAPTPGTQQINHTGADSPFGFLTVSPNPDEPGAYLLSYTPPRQTSTGLLTPERTPTTNKPANKSLVASKKSLPAAGKNKNYQRAAVSAPHHQAPAAHTSYQVTSPKQDSSTNPSDTPFEATLRAALTAEIRVLDEARLEKERKEEVEMTERANNYVKGGTDFANAGQEKKSEYEIGKENARKNLNSEVYHTTGFAYHDICLTRVELTKNTNERVLLSIYEADFCPPNYVTFVGFHGPGTDFKSEFLANGTDFKTAFLEFRKAFKKYTRVSWEARLIPQDYITLSAKTWEKQRLDRLMFERVGEQREGGRSRSASPVREGGEKNRIRSRKRVEHQRPEDVLTEKELESCKIKRYKYVPPSAHSPQGERPPLDGDYPVVPGDDPKDGGWTLVIP